MSISDRNWSVRTWFVDVRSRLTLRTGLVDSNDGLFVCRIDGLKGLALNTLHELAINVQAEWLLVGNARGLDFLSQRHFFNFSLVFL